MSNDLKTYATIAGPESLYTFMAAPHKTYGVSIEAGNKNIWSADGSIRATHHRNVRYYADVTGMSYAEARTACEAAKAAREEQEARRKAEREQRTQERIAEQYTERDGVYAVDIPCNKMLSSGREVRILHRATVRATSRANAWAQAINSKPAHLYNEELMERCDIQYLGAAR